MAGAAGYTWCEKLCQLLERPGLQLSIQCRTLQLDCWSAVVGVGHWQANGQCEPALRVRTWHENLRCLTVRHCRKGSTQVAFAVTMQAQAQSVSHCPAGASSRCNWSNLAPYLASTGTLHNQVVAVDCL